MLKDRVERGGEEVDCGICCCHIKTEKIGGSFSSQLCKVVIKRMFVE